MAREELRCAACGSPVAPSPALEGRDRLYGVPGTFGVWVCGACGSGVTVPAVEEGQLWRLYPAEYGSHGLPASPVLRTLATGLFRARYRRALGRPPLDVLRKGRGRLLDVGSGRGDLGVVARGLGWEVTGLDPSKDAAAEARERGVPTEVGTLATAADRLSGPYDVVVFQHALEHVVDPAADLSRARELLVRGGRLLVSLPNFGSWQARRFGSSWFHLDLPRHRSHFTRAGLSALLERTGFSEVVVTTSTSADGLPMSVSFRVRRRDGARAGAARLFEVAAVLATTPLTVAANAVAGEGDLLHAVAVRA